MIFNRDSDEMEDETIEQLKEYYYSTVLPELFDYPIVSDIDEQNELQLDPESYIE